MAVCPNCGAKIRDYAVTCPKCHMPTGSAVTGASTIKLKTNRGFLKFFLLSIITFGIYPIVYLTHLGEDVDVVAFKGDGENSLPYWIVAVLCIFLPFLIFPIIMNFVWYDKLCDRVEEELHRRSISYKFDDGTFWGWGVLGCFILIGPIVFYHKLFKAMNYLCADYNLHG